MTIRSERWKNAPSRFHEIVESGKCPSVSVKASTFTPGRDPFMEAYPGDPEAVFRTRKRKEIAAHKKEAVPWEPVEVRTKSRERREKAAKSRKKALRKAFDEACKEQRRIGEVR